MKILILGGDGYLGWPTAMHFADLGENVTIVDNYFRRHTAENYKCPNLLEAPLMDDRTNIFEQSSGKRIKSLVADLSVYENMRSVFEQETPDTVIHFAEQPSAPFSMAGFREAELTLLNNLRVTFNCLWATKEITPRCHIIKLGTMGEYGTPNIDIEEGWIDISHKGRTDKFLYPRQASSLYHTTKILDTDLIWFYVRNDKLAVTDLMQGPVWGLITPQNRENHKLLPHFSYDGVFGTVVNRFVAQAISGCPLSVYGRGDQIRGYININDTMKCIEIAATNPPENGQLRIYNQITETLSVNEIASKVVSAAKLLRINATISRIKNPRKEAEHHYYNPTYDKLTQLGLSSYLMDEAALCELMETLLPYKEMIDTSKFDPQIKW